jgi:hypothetical protein
MALGLFAVAILTLLANASHPCRRDKSVPGAASYQHWGQYIEGELIQPEPNNFENCAGGNFSQSYGKAAGWDDQNCDTEFIYICRMPSECPQGMHALLVQYGIVTI